MNDLVPSKAIVSLRRAGSILLIVSASLVAPLVAGDDLLPVLAFDMESSVQFQPVAELRLTAGTTLELEPLQVRAGFLGRHMLPRMAHQLRGLAPIHSLEIERSAFQQSELHAWVSGTVEQRTLRGTRKAIRDYFVTETPIAQLVNSFRVGRHGFGRPRDDQSLDFGVGLSHGLPRIEMRHRSSAGTLRMNVDLAGSAGLDFRPSGSSNARIYAGYDAIVSQYVLAYRCGF